ncbi:MAG: SDR family oxidoreductase [Boseongicola sp. SB0667_bin_21]|nr:SDR family oxidoreductase [Boseongicola sp. SB0667_bin_21]
MVGGKSPAGRPGVPDDIAYAAVYLGSDESLHVSGHNLVIDAAHTATRMAFDELNAMKTARSKVIEGD